MKVNLLLKWCLGFLLGANLTCGGAGTLDNWTPRVSGTASTLWGITHAAGQFVAVGEGATILTSPDGLTWTLRTNSYAGRLRSVTHGKGMFVAVGDRCAGCAPANANVLTSTNGVDWALHAAPTAILQMNSVTFGNGTFVATAGALSSDVLASTNGVDWMAQSLAGIALSGCTYAQGKFVLSGSHILVSSNAVAWTNRFSSSQTLRAVTYGNGRFAAVGDFSFSAPAIVVTSPDALNWTSATPGNLFSLRGVAYGSSNFVAVGTSGQMGSSADGLQWISRVSGVSDSLYGIAHADGSFVVVGLNGRILQATIAQPPVLAGRMVTGSGFEITVTAQVGRNYRLQATDDLLAWQDIVSFTATQPVTTLVDATTDSFIQRFYRVVTP